VAPSWKSCAWWLCPTCGHQWPALIQLATECDGYFYYRSARATARDPGQTTPLEDAGWTVARIRQGLGGIGKSTALVQEHAALTPASDCLVDLKTLARKHDPVTYPFREEAR
jgi:hypothetical protein